MSNHPTDPFTMLVRRKSSIDKFIFFGSDDRRILRLYNCEKFCRETEKPFIRLDQQNHPTGASMSKTVIIKLAATKREKKIMANFFQDWTMRPPVPANLNEEKEKNTGGGND